MGGWGGQYHNVLAVFGQVQKLSAILVTVVYLTMTMRWLRRHTISKLIIRYVWYGRAMTSYDLILDRTTSHNRHTIVVRHHRGRTTISPLSYIRQCYLLTTQSYWSCTSSYDYLSTFVRCRTIYLWFNFPPGNHSQVVGHRTTIVRLSYDVMRFPEFHRFQNDHGRVL